MGVMIFRVSCDLAFNVSDDAVLALQIAPSAHAGAVVEEKLITIVDGGREATLIELAADHGGRIHVLSGMTGAVSITYEAVVEHEPVANLAPHGGGPATRLGTLDLETITYLRQSRYCPSDQIAGFAAVQFPHDPGGLDGPAAVASWVFERLAYEIGSSDPLDTAVDTLLKGAGVCRDFAHLTVALCRALGYPSRLVSVYAPGLSPMDFHAVAEVHHDGAWHVHDATRLAPRSSLVRIATGRDAADTAFASTIAGDAELTYCQVSATVDGYLPADDHAHRWILP
jgi:transglutaminase-like putative cysteine protease